MDTSSIGIVHKRVWKHRQILHILQQKKNKYSIDQLTSTVLMLFTISIDFISLIFHIVSTFQTCNEHRMGGLVLDAAVNVYKGFVVFQPIINGIGGNLVSVQASKISTMLHQSSIIGIVPPHSKICESPWRALINGGNAIGSVFFCLSYNFM